MSALTSKQKATVRKYAQNIKPLFQIGAEGLHGANVEAIKEGFNQREVLKVKVNREDKTDKKITKTIASELEQKISCDVCGVIGTTIIIYKENKKIEHNKRIFK